MAGIVRVLGDGEAPHGSPLDRPALQRNTHPRAGFQKLAELERARAGARQASRAKVRGDDAPTSATLVEKTLSTPGFAQVGAKNTQGLRYAAAKSARVPSPASYLATLTSPPVRR